MLFELTLLAKEAEVETLSDALMEIDALSVSVEDADADTEHEEALWGEPGMPVAREAWQRSTIKSLFPYRNKKKERTKYQVMEIR